LNTQALGGHAVILRRIGLRRGQVVVLRLC
jgi:hypothetical protein